ncbi:ferritin-like domain-containing protein [Plastorhodobacter daqingensis]|uniref:Ferritin-like domain-containing protein n=1 Tax=Plastorhodobacter daqingensis TaxID=1387281 RepID=A0ABW2UN67_9RHOB
MEEIRKNFVDWLRDAHAAEEQALTMLKGQAGRIENYPALRERIEQHIRETEGQAEAIARLLERYDTSASTLKDMTSKMTATFQDLSGVFASDEVMKGAMFSYAFEHMEIASYRILITTAELLDDAEAVSVLRGILKEEEAMADWLLDNLDPLTRSFLGRSEADLDAKR